jgi:hypothetical protein
MNIAKRAVFLMAGLKLGFMRGAAIYQDLINE